LTDDPVEEAQDSVFKKGQSKRIWGELYKVIDSSDVVIHVLDARDPMGTRCKNVESFLKKEAKHKHLIFVLNKCDLVPTWVTVCFNLSFYLCFHFCFYFPFFSCLYRPIRIIYFTHRSVKAFVYPYGICLLQQWEIKAFQTETFFPFWKIST